jgi:hypothetical protein
MTQAELVSDAVWQAEKGVDFLQDGDIERGCIALECAAAVAELISAKGAKGTKGAKS